MKRRLLLICSILTMMLSVAACNNDNSGFIGLPKIELSAENIVSIDVFYGAVPVDLHEKHVTDEENIEKIINALNTIEFVRRAKPYDALSGGVGPIFLVNFQDGSHFIISANYIMAYYQGEDYVIKDIDLYSIYEELPYDEVLVGEAGSPSYRNSAHDYIITDIKDNTITVADIMDKDNLFTFSAGEDILFLINNEEGNISRLNIGDRIHVEHNGIIQETYPASIGKVYKVIVIDELHGTELDN